MSVNNLEHYKSLVRRAASGGHVATEDLQVAVDVLGPSVARELGLNPEQWHRIEVRLGQARPLHF